MPLQPIGWDISSGFEAKDRNFPFSSAPDSMRRFVFLSIFLVASCGSLEGNRDHIPRHMGKTALPAPTTMGSVDSRVQTVQLYRASEETSLPVLELGSGENLVLEFDLVGGNTGEPLDIRFQHTDRAGNPDLSTSEAFSGFDRDQVREFRSSSLTAVPYVHYEYAFPNSSIEFQVSGRYELVVENPDDGSAMLRLPFFVSEDNASVDLVFGVNTTGYILDAVQPAAGVRPDAELGSLDEFQVSVCFSRDGRMMDQRCTGSPSLVDLSLFQYRLDADDAFALPIPLYEMNLGFVGIGGEVTEADRAARPPTAVLDVDNADFSEAFDAWALTGQPLIVRAFQESGNPRVNAEYVDVTFRYQSSQASPYDADLHVVGSFNGWRPAPENRLDWDEETQRYEGVVRLKQGRHSYGYVVPRSPRLTETIGSRPVAMTAFVFFEDLTLFTDRLLAVQTEIAR